jgi:predicted RecB family nuclease
MKPDGTLAIYDWKRIEELKTENQWQSGLGPVTHLPDTNYWHYSLQLNVYRYILQKHYGFVVSELALVVLHPSNKSWKVAKLNFMDEEVADMMAARARALKENDGSSPVVVF